MTSQLPDTVVADANILLSAAIGGRAGIILTSSRGPRCIAADAVSVEVARYLPVLAKKRGLDLGLLQVTFALMPVDWRNADFYQLHRLEAQARMRDRDPDDWPTVALALATGHPIWSQDRDLEAAGLPLFTTGQLLGMLGRDL